MATGMEIRAWARDNGFQVADHGRISADVIDAYLKAHTAKLDQAGGEPTELGGEWVTDPSYRLDLAPSPDAPGVPPSGGPGSTEPTLGAPDAEGPPSPAAGWAPRYTRSRMPGVLYLPGRGKVHLKHDRPGKPG